MGQSTEDRDRHVDSEEQRICPYLEIECTGNCPGWLQEISDCVFHVCLTEVKDTFVAAAQYLEKHLGMAPGFGQNTLTSLRGLMKGTATKDQKEVVRSVVVSLVQTAVLPKLARMTVQDIAGLVGKAESKISFAFGTLFGTDDTGGPEIS